MESRAGEGETPSNFWRYRVNSCFCENFVEISCEFLPSRRNPADKSYPPRQNASIGQEAVHGSSENMTNLKNMRRNALILAATMLGLVISAPLASASYGGSIHIYSDSPGNTNVKWDGGLGPQWTCTGT